MLREDLVAISLLYFSQSGELGRIAPAKVGGAVGANALRNNR